MFTLDRGVLLVYVSSSTRRAWRHEEGFAFASCSSKASAPGGVLADAAAERRQNPRSSNNNRATENPPAKTAGAWSSNGPFSWLRT